MQRSREVREANEAIIERFWQALTRGRRDELEALFADDAVWHFPPVYRETQGIEDARGSGEIASVFTQTPQRFYRGRTLRLERQVTVVDESQAAIQFEMRGETANGGRYYNRYVFTFRIADGRITEGWEHLDSAYFDLQMNRAP